MVDQGDIPIVYYTFNEGDGNIVRINIFLKARPTKKHLVATQLATCRLYILESTKNKL